MKTRKHALAIGVIAAFVTLVTVTATFASSGLLLRKKTTGADFGIAKADGYRKWCPFVWPNTVPGGYCQHGGFEFHGTLKDTITTDGDNVVSKVRVEGYAWSSFYGTKNGSKYQAWEVYDYQATSTNNAEYKVCRDRSAPYADNCNTIGWVTRPN